MFSYVSSRKYFFVEIETPEGKIAVELADSFLKRAKGLSFRTEGKMLFKFSRPTKMSVDMMLVSRRLNLYFLDGEKEVIEVQRAEPWGFDPRTWKLYSPDRPYKYLLESFEDLRLEKGDKIDW